MNYLSIENVVGREILLLTVPLQEALLPAALPQVSSRLLSFVTATKADTLAKVFRRLLITSTT